MKMRLNKLLLAGAAAAIMLSMHSCGIYGKYKTPDNTALTAAYAQAREQAVDSAALGNMLWENVFTDPLLTDYINQALTNNTSLRNARSNVKIAQAQLQGARLAYLPSITLAPNGGGASYAGSDLSWTYSIQANASWEVDIFGKTLNNKRKAQAAVYQSEAYAQAVRSQIISAVANCYYGIAITSKQLDLYRNTATLWKESVEVMKNLKEAGRTTEAAVVQSTANYYNILAGITDLETSLVQLHNTMSLLLNVMPQTWEVTPGAELALPAALQEGVPMSVLAFRPDVAVAEQNLAQAFYATSGARAAFYPGLTLTATGGFTNLLGSFIKNPGDFFYQLGGSLALPLFARGQRVAALKAAKESQQQALNNFEYALLSAASEVEHGMTVYVKAVEKQGLLREQVANLEKSVEYTNDLLLYANGTYLEVLTAQQSLLNAQVSALNTELTRTRAIINLYQSMGGGR